jgi:Zn-dependent peptidase ImmA (M78 family)/DNA-binding XRE family transcriptional regulator
MVATKAHITPEVLRWARERVRQSPADVAEHLDVYVEAVKQWEAGSTLPTLRQAQRLADWLRIPLGYLFLPGPPTESLPIPDLRTVGGEPAREPSPDLMDVVNDALLKQQWYREYIEQESARPLPFVGRYSVHDEPEEVAADIRVVTGLDAELRRRAHSTDEFLRLAVERVEAAGVLVLRSSVVGNNTRRKLDVAEFRGFALSDPIAPLVFINSQDAKPAQVFTLAHELAHIWIGASGVSNPAYLRSTQASDSELERLCNRAAAETLAPRDEFLACWPSAGSLDEKLDVVAARFRVSAQVVLRRAYDLKLIGPDLYRQMYASLSARESQRHGDESEGGGDFYATLFARNSRKFTTALISAVEEGSALYGDAARLLGVKMSTLGEIARRLYGTEPHSSV